MQFNRQLLPGFCYFGVSVLLLLMYFFVLSPLSEYRIEFEVFRSSQRHLAEVRDSLTVVQGRLTVSGATNQPSNVPIYQFLNSLKEKASAIGQAKLAETVSMFAQSRTELESLEMDASKAFGMRTNFSPRHVFVQYLLKKDESLYKNPATPLLAYLSPPLLSLLTFLVFCSGLSFFFNSIRLLRLTSIGTPFKNRVFLYPFFSPILAVLFVVCLRGYGPVFTSEMDAATNRFILIVAVACAFSPLILLETLRDYVLKIIDKETKGES